jgi:hypothetical protein
VALSNADWLESFREIWAADFEFVALPGERPNPVCLVAKELRTAQEVRLWRDQFGPAPPYPIGGESLFVAYYASAELGCHRALNWPMPARILDLFTEFRDRTNGLETPSGASLLGALIYFGLDHIGAQEKEAVRDLVMRGGPWSPDERAAVLDYCASDVDALARLLPAMLPRLDLPHALLRGRYMAAVSAMEHNGVPIDVPMLGRFQRNWTSIQDRLIIDVDKDFHVYEGRTFKTNAFEYYLAKRGMPWPRLESGNLDLDEDAFKIMVAIYPEVAPLKDLRHILGEMRLSDLVVGKDGRNRTILSAFGSRTGRNQPSNAKFIFGPSTWLRSLIKPPPGYGVTYIDWSQQEFGIAAALSGDVAMLAAYGADDPYIEFGKQAGMLPADATKESHGLQREVLKKCVLGVQYGIGAETLALRIEQPAIVARDLLRAHRETYRRFWRWSDGAVDQVMLRNSLSTVFGWHIHADGRRLKKNHATGKTGGRAEEGPNPRSMRNFPMQANGAEMLRLACCLATEHGIEVCAPVHDAVLICAPLDRLDEDVALMRAAMAEASRAVLDGFELKTDATLVRYPDRYADKRGIDMWARICGLLGNVENEVADRGVRIA